MGGVAPNTLSNTIDKYIIITFCRVSTPCPCHPYTFTIKNYSWKFASMSFWLPALKFHTDSSLIWISCHKQSKFSIVQEFGGNYGQISPNLTVNLIVQSAVR